MATHGSLLSRFDAAEYRLCRRLNRGVEHTWVRVLFKTASRLGDGVIWYALMLALPFIYGSEGFKVALIMPLSGLYAYYLTRLMQRYRVAEPAARLAIAAPIASSRPSAPGAARPPAGAAERAAGAKVSEHEANLG